MASEIPARLSAQPGKEALRSIMQEAEEHLEHGRYEVAAKMFREAAVSYRLAAYDQNAQLAESQLESEALRIYSDWLGNKADELMHAGHKSFPAISHQQVSMILHNDVMPDPGTQHLLRFLQAQLGRHGILPNPGTGALDH